MSAEAVAVGVASRVSTFSVAVEVEVTPEESILFGTGVVSVVSDTEASLDSIVGGSTTAVVAVESICGWSPVCEDSANRACSACCLSSSRFFLLRLVRADLRPVSRASEVTSC